MNGFGRKLLVCAHIFVQLWNFCLTRETLKLFRVWAKYFTAEQLKLENSAQNIKRLPILLFKNYLEISNFEKST